MKPNPIYYAINEMPDGRWASLVLCETMNKTGCFVPGPSNEITYHSSLKEARTNVLEIQKPHYYEVFGPHYELIECDPYSPEWHSMVDKWDSYTDEMLETLTKIQHLLQSPWYVRLLWNIKELFKKTTTN